MAAESECLGFEILAPSHTRSILTIESILISKDHLHPRLGPTEGYIWRKQAQTKTIKSFVCGSLALPFQRLSSPRSTAHHHLRCQARSQPALSSPFCLLCWCCSVTKSCLTVYDPMDCSKPGFPVLQFRFMSIESVMPSNHLILCHPLSSYLQSFPASGSFLMSQLFSSGGQSIGASASASVLAMNFQSWFCLGLTDLISL